MILAAITVAQLLGCQPQRGPAGESAATPASPIREQTIEQRRITLTNAALTFDAAVDIPARRNGAGVLLIGGGLGNDLDWTTPGSLRMDGVDAPLTITGNAHADGPILSRALAQRGFVVLRWSTLAREDPLAGQWPLRATPRSSDELLGQTGAALDALADIAGDRIVLVAHSLGAARACVLAQRDQRVRALVLLSPAYFTKPQDRVFAGSGLRFGADIAQSRPCLALFGSLDRSRPVDAAGARELVQQPMFAGLEVRILEGLGHQLGPVEGALIGPIDPSAVGLLAQWAEGQITPP